MVSSMMFAKVSVAVLLLAGIYAVPRADAKCSETVSKTYKLAHAPAETVAREVAARFRQGRVPTVQVASRPTANEVEVVSPPGTQQEIEKFIRALDARFGPTTP